MIKYLVRSWIILMLFASVSCIKKKDKKIEECDFETAVSFMPNYHQLLLYLLQNDYEIWSFRKFLASDRSALPKKLVILRHDVHGLDITPCYYMYRIEKELLGNDFATYFVQLNDPTELKDKKLQKRYANLIAYFKEEGVDVQGHISPNDMVQHQLPNDVFWSKEIDVAFLQNLFDVNYKIKNTPEGKEVVVIGEDIFDISYKAQIIAEQLVQYEIDWKKETGLDVVGFAAHGSTLPMNKVINNAIWLDMEFVKKYGNFEYDAYNIKPFKGANYLSDSDNPDWMTHFDLIEDKRFRMLCHPNQWYILK